MGMLRILKTYFIGEALRRTDLPFTIMRIKFVYSFSIISIILNALSLMALVGGKFWYTSFTQAYGLFNVILMLLSLRLFKNYYVSGFIWLVNCVSSALMMTVITGGALSIVGVFWMMFSIVSVFIILGPKWGGRVFIYYFILIFLGIMILDNNIERLEVGINFSHDRILHANPELLGVIVPTLFTVYALYAFLTAQKKTEDVLREQVRTVKKQKNKITDSIIYAKRIQSAILPPVTLLNSSLKKHFVLYKPKDIIAGDFYWLENSYEKTLFAVGDCTGHGVPGAMISVVCNNALNRSVKEYGLTDPGEILDKTKEIVLEEFSKSEEDVKDGMDIALCSLQGRKLKYAGAYNPLWIIRRGEIIETKGNRQPVGKQVHSIPFITHEIDLEKGDLIYLFSDGYVDQFGGENGKKFKPKAFRELLLSIHSEKINKQKRLIHNAFEKWKGDRDQIDDVCVMALRI